MITAGDILDFILANRKEKVFVGWTREKIADDLADAIKNNTVLYAHHGGKVTGVLFWEKDMERRVIYVTQNLALSLSNLKTFARVAKKRWTGWKIEGDRHNRLKQFNTTKLYKKLKV